MERIVPFMAMLYILGGIGILLMNINAVPGAVALIFKSAFTPMAGVGGFAGATVKEAMRYGIARGLYSNDAGTGYGIVVHAKTVIARDKKYPPIFPYATLNATVVSCALVTFG